MPMDESEEVAPELMRLRIISVAAENWGTYLGGESELGVGLLPLPEAAEGLEGSFEAIVVVGADCRLMRRKSSRSRGSRNAIDALSGQM